MSAGGSSRSISDGLLVAARASYGLYIVGEARNDDGVDEPFRWDAENGMRGLGPCPAEVLLARAADASGDGSVVVGPDRIATFPATSFIWDEQHGCRTLSDALTNEFGLDLSGWFLISATGISDDGRTIVGYGQNPQGDREAWMAVIQPSVPLVPALGLTPRVLLGALLAGMGLFVFHRRG